MVEPGYLASIAVGRSPRSASCSWIAILLAGLVPLSACWANGPIETCLVQVHPRAKEPGLLVRSAERTRAVVLIAGLHLHLLEKHVALAHLRDWQEPGSLLVETLGKEADVFALGYSQNVSLPEIAELPILEHYLSRVHRLGYAEIVLVGHSAGGLIARQFVEDHPDAGVTKVIQVCPPNAGCSLAAIENVHRNQKAFLGSLTREGRQQVLAKRRDRKVPQHVEFICVVGCGAGSSDGVVACECQWPPDLREQCIPAIRLPTAHFLAMRTAASVRTIAELVRQPQSRWDPAKVAAMRKELLQE